MSLKSKNILLVSVILVAISIFYLAQGVAHYNRDLQADVAHTEQILDETIKDILHYSFTPYQQRIISFTWAHPQIIEAFARRDREQLYRLTLPVYQAFKRENPYLHTLPFVLPDSTMFLRMHKPDYFGDDLSGIRPIMESVHRNHRQLVGFEVGRLGAYYRIVQPLFYDEQYIGLVEMGIRVEQVVDSLRDKLNIPVALFFRNEVWEKVNEQQAAQLIRGDHTVLVPEGSPFARLPEHLKLGTDQHPQVVIDGRTHVVHAHAALKNYHGEEIGGILLLQDITADLELRRAFVLRSIFLTLAVLCLAFVVLYAGFSRLMADLELAQKQQQGLLAELQEEIGEHEKTEIELRSYRDRLEERVRERTAELETAMGQVKTLRGFLPICAHCKKIRDDQGYWKQIESYIRDHSEADFSHSICPDCIKLLYPDLRSPGAMSGEQE